MGDMVEDPATKSTADADVRPTRAPARAGGWTVLLAAVTAGFVGFLVGYNYGAARGAAGEDREVTPVADAALSRTPEQPRAVEGGPDGALSLRALSTETGGAPEEPAPDPMSAESPQVPDEKKDANLTGTHSEETRMMSGGVLGRRFLLGRNGIDELLSSVEVNPRGLEVSDEQRKAAAEVMRTFRKEAVAAWGLLRSGGGNVTSDYQAAGDYEVLSETIPGRKVPPNNNDADLFEYFWLVTGSDPPGETWVVTIRRADYPELWRPVDSLARKHDEALDRIRGILGY